MSLLRIAASLAIAAAVLNPASALDRDISHSLGVKLFPGASERPGRTRYDQKKGAVSLEDVIASNVAADVFVSSQPPDRVLSFYRSELKRLGAVTECHGGANPRVHVRVDADSVSDPSACHIFDFGIGDTELKAVRNGEQFIVAIGETEHGTEFAIVHVESAHRCPPGKCEMI